MENNGRHPANSANFLSLLTCWWMNGIFRTGNKRPLQKSDFLPLNEEDKTKVQTEKLQEQWDKHVRECSITPGKEPKLWKCVVKILSFKEVSFLLSFWFIESVFRVTLPLALGLLLASIHSTERNQPLVIGCCLFIGMTGVFSATTHYSAFRCDLLGMRLSSALKGIVYRKVKDLWCILMCCCCIVVVVYLFAVTITKILSSFAIERFSFGPQKLITGGKLKQIANKNIRIWLAEWTDSGYVYTILHCADTISVFKEVRKPWLDCDVKSNRAEWCLVHQKGLRKRNLNIPQLSQPTQRRQKTKKEQENKQKLERS